MVLCKHFQQGSCRFGSKCNFEHIDIKQLVKSDTEGAINGKQYLFSCYGPFKDKACVPNFIQDQSFEEIRFMCYEAKQKGCFEQFHQQLQMQAIDAMNKMKALTQPSYEIMNVLTTIYDTPVGNGNQQQTNSNSNPFGLGANTANNNNTTANSIFGKSSIAQVNNNNANGFGGSGGTGIFGGGATTNNMQTGGGIFGGQNTFGTQQPQQSSIFGQAAQQQQQTTPSIFGGGNSALAKPSIFGQQPAAQNIADGSFGIFGQAANMQQGAPIFGQTANFGQTQQMQTQQPQQGASLFGQSTFGNQAPNVNLFGQSQPQAQPQQQQQNMFGQTNPMMPQAQQQPGTGLFAQAAQQQPSQPVGFFQQTVTPTMTTENMPQAQQLQQPFMQTQQPQAPVAADFQPQSVSLPQSTDSVYSRMEDLTAEQIAAFKAEIFEPGKLPFVPPPAELIN